MNKCRLLIAMTLFLLFGACVARPPIFIPPTSRPAPEPVVVQPERPVAIPAPVPEKPKETPPPQPQPEPEKFVTIPSAIIGAALPLSGSGSQYGDEIANGIQLAFATSADMVKNKNIKLRVTDTGGAPDKAETVLNSFATDQDMLGVIGPAFSKEYERAAQIATKFEIPVFSPAATAENLVSGSSYTFRNVMTNRVEARKIAELAVKEMGLKKFAVIYPADPAGKELLQFFREEISKAGGTLTVLADYNPAVNDFGDPIRRIGGQSDAILKKAGMAALAEEQGATTVEAFNAAMEKKSDIAPAFVMIKGAGVIPANKHDITFALTPKYDAVYIAGPFDKAARILAQMDYYNLRGMTRIVGKGANNPEFPKAAGRFADGVIFVGGFFLNSDAPQVKQFVRNYRLAFLEDPTQLSAQAYDAARMMLSAIEKGVSNRTEMGVYLRNIVNFDGVSGMTTINQSGEADKSVFYLTVKDGKIAEFKPEQPQTGVPAQPVEKK